MVRIHIVFGFLFFATVSAQNCPYDDVGLQPWDDENTWGGSVPLEGEQVIISSSMNVLLNVSPPSLGSITIEEGGSLIWGDVDGLTLKVSYILVNGNFEIGSEDCRFTKKANIVLTGLTNSPLEVEGYGRKFIGVAEKGTVEFHGGNKLSWTKLIQTVPAAKNTCGAIYNHQKKTTGLHTIVFNLDGSLHDFQLFLTAGRSPLNELNKFNTYLNGIPVDKIVVVYVQRELGKYRNPDVDWDTVFTAIETIGGLETGSSVLRDVLRFEAYAFITRTGQSSLTKEHRDVKLTNELALDVPETSLRFLVQDGTITDVVVLTIDAIHPKIKLMTDVTSWKVDDEIVVASTDFEWDQAEVFKIIACPDCESDEVKLDRQFTYMHYGEITYGVDERAEVILLTRDIVIEGELEDTCYSNNDREAQLCTFFQTDTFGGHFKMMRGFQAAHIEQVEFYHMGQQAFLGSYPIHFHMCDDVDGAWVRSNSIHHSQARCVTIHGTDGLEVSDNVCYRHRGHGFFLEDSAEQRNIINGNVGMGTEYGALIITDMSRAMCDSDLIMACDKPATFWITHPNNFFTNNVAAGSVKNGFQLSVSREPIGPSKERQLERGLVTRDSAVHTKITLFRNNVAHSNADSGLFIEGFLSPGQTHRGTEIPENGFLSGTSHKPLDSMGNVDTSFIENFIAYKNKVMNIWTRGGNIVVDHATLADSPRGIAMATASGITYSMVNNSLFIGETDNIGNPKPGQDRSYAHRRLDSPLRGMVFYQGPVFLRNSFFDVYKHRTIAGKVRRAGAIGFKARNPYPSTPNSGIRAIKFGFCDSTGGNFVFDSLHGELSGFGNADGNREITFLDSDGSVTSSPNTQVVKSGIKFITTPCCVHRDNWNMDVCPLEYATVKYQLRGSSMGTTRTTFPIYMRRDDIPEETDSSKGQMGVRFVLIKGKSYTTYFNGSAPEDLYITGNNLEIGDSIRVGICYNKDVENLELFTWNLPGGDGVEVATIEELDSSDKAEAYFWDRARGLFFFKLMSFSTRLDGEMCPGGPCPRWLIRRTGGSDTKPDCYADAYSGVYNKAEDVATESCLPSTTPVCDIASSTGYGATVNNVDIPSSVFELTCPSATLAAGRTTRELQGCFKDDSRYRDLVEMELKLYYSMTSEVCIERCYHHGYAYAALQSGRECRCGDAYGIYGEDPTGCTIPCTGDKQQMCGGRVRNLIYSTGKAASLIGVSPSCGADNKGTVVGGQCLYVSEDKANYWDAQNACVKMGGDLATISTSEMQADVIDYIRPVAADVWFGLHDAYNEGELVFADGTALSDFDYFHPYWDNSDNSDYAYMHVRSLFHWILTSGRSLRHYLCTISMDGNTDTGEPCGANDYGRRLGSSGACYAVINEPTRYLDAAHQCWIRNGIPAPAENLDNLGEIVKHVQLFGISNTDYFVGDGGFFEELYFELVYMQLYSVSEIRYTTRNGIVCLIETVDSTKPCSTGWTQNNNYCYLYQGGIVSNEEALSVCTLGSSQFVTVDSEEENIFVGDLVKNFKSDRHPKVTLDIKYDQVSKSFKNGDGSALAFSNWYRGNGNGNVRRGECMTYSTHDPTYSWRNRVCRSLYSALVCKQPVAT